MSGLGTKILAWFIRPQPEKRGGQIAPPNPPVLKTSAEIPLPPVPPSAKPSGTVILAARHLDPAEGVMRAGHVVTDSDESAIRTVLAFVAARHDDGSP